MIPTPAYVTKVSIAVHMLSNLPRKFSRSLAKANHRWWLAFAIGPGKGSEVAADTRRAVAPDVSAKTCATTKSLATHMPTLLRDETS